VNRLAALVALMDPGPMPTDLAGVGGVKPAVVWARHRRDEPTWRCSQCGRPVPAECDGACGTGTTSGRKAAR
jgi:hypothetical protein